MELTEHMTCFGQVHTFFSCPSCGNARSFDLVREERSQRTAKAPPAEASIPKAVPQDTVSR